MVLPVWLFVEGREGKGEGVHFWATSHGWGVQCYFVDTIRTEVGSDDQVVND